MLVHMCVCEPTSRKFLRSDRIAATTSDDNRKWLTPNLDHAAATFVDVTCTQQ